MRNLKLKSLTRCIDPDEVRDRVAQNVVDGDSTLSGISKTIVERSIKGGTQEIEYFIDALIYYIDKYEQMKKVIED